MTNGEIIMQKAKQILAYCNTFTQEEVERSFLGEIDLEEESAKRAKDVIEKEMFGIKSEILINLFDASGRSDLYTGYLCKNNNVSIVVRRDYEGNIFWFFDTGNENTMRGAMSRLSDAYTIDKSDIIDRYKDKNSHLFFNKEGVFITQGKAVEGRFFE